jgi:hypothetical protein
MHRMPCSIALVLSGVIGAWQSYTMAWAFSGLPWHLLSCLQDALQRRLVERATSHERDARQRAQEVASLRKAADAARRRIAELELENKAHKALAKVGKTAS